MRSGRRPSPEGTRSLFAGTISPVIYPVDGPTEGRHDKTRRKTRQETKGTETELKNETSSPIDYPIDYMSSWWAKDDTRDSKEGRDEGPENKIIKQKTKKDHKNKTCEHRATQPTQGGRVRGGTIKFAGTGQHIKKEKRDCNTVSSSRLVSPTLSGCLRYRALFGTYFLLCAAGLIVP